MRAHFAPNATIVAVMTVSFALFDTAAGCCAIAWGAHGIIGIQLPEANEKKTRSRVLQRFPGAQEAVPPPNVALARDAIAGCLRGTPADLSSIALDMEALPPFHRRVYEAARAIAWGATATYGALAEVVGTPGAARAVGQALARNPFPIIVPCHRVVAAGAKIGGFSAHGGTSLKLRLLAIEGHRRRGEGERGRGKQAQKSGAPSLFEEPLSEPGSHRSSLK